MGSDTSLRGTTAQPRPRISAAQRKKHDLGARCRRRQRALPQEPRPGSHSPSGPPGLFEVAAAAHPAPRLIRANAGVLVAAPPVLPPPA